MALIAVSGLLPAGEPAAQPAGADSPAAQTPAAPGYFRGLDLSLGPVRWGGSLTAEYRVQQADSEAGLRDLFLIGNWNAASYVYQPWFAQITGNLGFIHASADTGLGEDTGSTSLTGGASLSLLPSSRFPFYGAYSVNDTRATGAAIGADYRIAQTTLRQSYRTADGATLYTASIERNELSNEEIGKDVLDVYGARVSSRKGAQSLDLDGQWSGNTGGRIGNRTEFARLGGRHAYVPASHLSVETLASYSRQEIEQPLVTSLGSIANTFAQVGSFASWRPQEDEPLYDAKHPLLVTGALRATRSSVGTGAAAADVMTLSGALGGTYDISPLTRLNANSALTHVSSGEVPDRLTSQLSAAVTYVPLPIRVDDYTYSWNLTGGASSLSDEERHLRSVNALAYHQLSRAVPLEGRSQAVFTVGQGLAGSSVSDSGGSGPASAVGEVAVLTHNAQATWSQAGGASGAQSYVGLSASDARSFGAVQNVFQLVNLQVTRQAPINAVSFWSANLTSQGTRQFERTGAPGADVDFNFSTFGGLSYEHRRAFGVPRLRFHASYVANQAQTQSSRAQGNLEAPREYVSDTFEARLDHQIGKLESRLLARSATVDGRRNNLMLLRVTRNF